MSKWLFILWHFESFSRGVSRTNQIIQFRWLLRPLSHVAWVPISPEQQPGIFPQYLPNSCVAQTHQSSYLLWIIPIYFGALLPICPTEESSSLEDEFCVPLGIATSLLSWPIDNCCSWNNIVQLIKFYFSITSWWAIFLYISYVPIWAGRLLNRYRMTIIDTSLSNAVYRSRSFDNDSTIQALVLILKPEI